MRRIVLLALCAMLAFGTPLAHAASSGEPCAGAAAAADGASCGCDLPTAVSTCAFACGFVFSSSPLAVAQPDLALPLVSDAAAAGPPPRFASRATTPALQPPR